MTRNLRNQNQISTLKPKWETTKTTYWHIKQQENMVNRMSSSFPKVPKP